jgi:hypothetical protein
MYPSPGVSSGSHMGMHRVLFLAEHATHREVYGH